MQGACSQERFRDALCLNADYLYAHFKRLLSFNEALCCIARHQVRRSAPPVEHVGQGPLFVPSNLLSRVQVFARRGAPPGRIAMPYRLRDVNKFQQNRF